MTAIQLCVAARHAQFVEFCSQIPKIAEDLQLLGISVFAEADAAGVRVSYCGANYRIGVATRPMKNDARYIFAQADGNFAAAAEVASAYCSPEGVLIPVHGEKRPPVSKLDVPEDTVYSANDVMHVFTGWLVAAAEKMPE